MTGTPIVTFGARLGSGDPAIYEVPNLVENGLHAFLSDSEEELLEMLLVLINNRELANSMSIEARSRAMQLFSKKVNKELWSDIIAKAVG
jgi:glycosyltransferase involved in cell wall biosynthesis